MRFLFLSCIAAVSLAAQDSSSDSSRNGTDRVTAAGQFFDHDFVNVYAFANGVWDSRVPAGVSSTGNEIFGSGLGWEAGGGITASHTFKDGGFTVNYRGSYRDYQSSTLGTGQQQSLVLGYTKRLNRRWTLGLSAAAGILGYGSSFYAATSIASETPGNSASIESRFANLGLSLTYAQTRRLSYVFTGSFLYNGYVTPKSISQNPFADPVSTRGVTGGLSVLYQLTGRTTIGATYSHSYYGYSRKSGSANIDSAALTLSHRFVDHWQLDLSAGANRSDSSGTALTPVSFVLAGVPVIGYCYCPYSRIITSPAYQGVLTRGMRHYSFSLSGGQSMLPGNGLYLASRDQFVNAALSYSTRRSNISAGGNYSRLSSVSTADLSKPYSYYGVSAGYGINLVRYISANLRYDFLHYDTAIVTGSINEHRVSFGLSVSSKSVPLTLF